MSSSRNDLSLKDIVNNIINYLHYLKRNFLWILLGIVSSVGIFLYSSYLDGIKYKADISFVVNQEDNSSSISLPSFGGAFSMGKDYKIASLEKILMLSKSENIIFSMLLSKLDNTDSLIVNKIIDEYDIVDTNPNLVYVSTNNFSNLSIKERKTLRYVKSKIVSKNGFLNTLYDQESQVFRLSARTKNEVLSYSVAQNTYDYLMDFYKENSIAKALNTVNTLKARKDSIKNVLEKGEYSLAIMRDKGSNYLYSTPAIERYRKKREVEFNTKLYLEVDNLLEVARYKLEGVKPIFTLIDYPYYPLRIIRRSFEESIQLGVLFGLLFSCVILILIRIFREVMNS